MAKPEKKTTRDWVLTSDGKIVCFKSSKAKQTVQSLWEVSQLTDFHDAELAKCTKEINAILDRVANSNKDPGRQLGFLLVGDGLLLTWSHYGATGSDDEPEVIAQVLKLK